MSVSVSDDGQVLTLKTQQQTLRFHAIWLRDNAWDAETRDGGNGQRLIALRDIPKDTYVAAAEQLSQSKINLNFMPEDKTIEYDVAWLQAHAYDRFEMPEKGWLKPTIEAWDSELMANLPEGDFVKLANDPQACSEWLQQFAKYGFAKVTNGPIEDGALYKVIDLFGYVRETNYGRHFEVRVEDNPVNLAFTGAAIQAHTDNPYRDPVPTVQLLYCLESSAPGGENMVVDGFHAARRLRDEDPHAFDLLSKYCAKFEFSGEKGVCLQSRKPMIELAPDGELIGVRFNNRSSAAITDVPFADMADYYAAYRRFGEILDDTQMEVFFRLNPGECFIFDNTRVLHARKAFAGSGSRWLQGCYADKDALWSRVAAAQREGV
jgi:gamma-butyrobetaine dioxygenase